MYTYFIITPGSDENCYVGFPTAGVKGNYFKFGDSKDEHEDTDNIREAYSVHNPDIGVACIMRSEYSKPALGTRLKKYLKEQLDMDTVGNGEWFSLDTVTAWRLFAALEKWDGAQIDKNNYGELIEVLDEYLK
jgi:hypothetical protein